LKAKKHEISEFNKRLEQEEAENQEQRRVERKAYTEAKKTAEKERDEIRAELKAIVADREKQASEHEAQIRAVEDERDALKQELEVAETTVKSLEATIQEQSATVNGYEEEVSTLRTQVSDLENANNTKQEKIDGMEAAALGAQIKSARANLQQQRKIRGHRIQLVGAQMMDMHHQMFRKSVLEKGKKDQQVRTYLYDELMKSTYEAEMRMRVIIEQREEIVVLKEFVEASEEHRERTSTMSYDMFIALMNFEEVNDDKTKLIRDLDIARRELASALRQKKAAQSSVGDLNAYCGRLTNTNAEYERQITQLEAQDKNVKNVVAVNEEMKGQLMEQACLTNHFRALKTPFAMCVDSNASTTFIARNSDRQESFLDATPAEYIKGATASNKKVRNILSRTSQSSMGLDANGRRLSQITHRRRRTIAFGERISETDLIPFNLPNGRVTAFKTNQNVEQSAKASSSKFIESIQNGTIRGLKTLSKAALKKILNNIPRELWPVFFANLCSLRSPDGLRYVDIYGLDNLSTALLHTPSPYSGTERASITLFKPLCFATNAADDELSFTFDDSRPLWSRPEIRVAELNTRSSNRKTEITAKKGVIKRFEVDAKKDLNGLNNKDEEKMSRRTILDKDGLNHAPRGRKMGEKEVRERVLKDGE
jgi:hypothetical protein